MRAGGNPGPPRNLSPSPPVINPTRVQPLNAALEGRIVARHSDLRIALSLDSLNFFLADVRDGLGQYLAIYLLAVHQWEPASIGVVMTLAGIAALLTQGP